MNETWAERNKKEEEEKEKKKKKKKENIDPSYISN